MNLHYLFVSFNMNRHTNHRTLSSRSFAEPLYYGPYNVGREDRTKSGTLRALHKSPLQNEVGLGSQHDMSPM